jgi:dTDP-4-dehydrorhamnose reductase
MTKLLITGSKGQLGNEIRELATRFPGLSMTFTDLEELDICDALAVNAFFAGASYDVVINCAAYTSVDKAETESDLAYRVNALAVGNLARACAKNNAFLVHVSTDYVFDGKNHRPYTESEPVKPLERHGFIPPLVITS